MLTNGIINVKFTKTDGSERLMKCTLLEGLAIPHQKKTERVKKPNEDIVAVWDVENEGWRSFNYNSVIEVYK